MECPTKYGKKLPKGQLRTFDKIWLSKIALVERAIKREPANSDCARAGREQWLWLDAGLEKDQVLRVLNHTKHGVAPQRGNVHIQFYCEAKSLKAEEYFNGMCPVRHMLNAKAMWADKASPRRRSAQPRGTIPPDACVCVCARACGGSGCRVQGARLLIRPLANVVPGRRRALAC